MPEKTTEGPGHYMLIVADVEFDPQPTGAEVARALFERGYWLASRATPFRGLYKPGDRVLFYVSGKKAGNRVFVGDAEVAEPCRDASPNEQKVADGLGLLGYDYVLPLCEIRTWKQPLSIRGLLPDLTFIKDKRNWGLYFRQAAARIPSEDFDRILSHAAKAPS